MDDLISRQAAIDVFEPWLKVKCYSIGELNMLKAVLYELQLLPSAKRKGEWKDYPISDGCVKCSRCGVLSMERTNYCATCGADMREENER